MMKSLNQVYHLIRTLRQISLFLVLIFGCFFPQNQSAGSYFAMFLFAGFYCTASPLKSFSKTFNTMLELFL